MTYYFPLLNIQLILKQVLIIRYTGDGGNLPDVERTANGNQVKFSIPSPQFSCGDVLVCFALKEEAGAFQKRVVGRAYISILITGIGRKNSERTLVERLNHLTSRLVLTCGFAGGLDPALAPGDVLCSTDDEGLRDKLDGSGREPGKVFLRAANRDNAAGEARTATLHGRGRDGNGIGGDSHHLPRTRDSVRDGARYLGRSQRGLAARFQPTQQTRFEFGLRQVAVGHSEVAGENSRVVALSEEFQLCGATAGRSAGDIDLPRLGMPFLALTGFSL